jgi:hypothetical protein
VKWVRAYEDEDLPSPVVSMLIEFLKQSKSPARNVYRTKGEYAADDQPMPRIKFELPNQEYSTLFLLDPFGTPESSTPLHRGQNVSFRVRGVGRVRSSGNE